MASTRVESPAVERIIISLPEDLLEKLTNLAKRIGLSRASYIRMVLTQHVNELGELETSDPQRRFSARFRKVSNRYPLRVTEAYEGNQDRAMADSDEEVAATVAEWERRQGLEVRGWPVIGREEGRE